MAPRYEYDDTNAELVICSPHDPDDWGNFDDDFPAEKAVADDTRALVIGNPYGSAYAIFGTLGDLAGFAGRIRARVDAARRADPVDGEAGDAPPATGAA